MLRYEIKLGSDDLVRSEMEWSEGYVSQDLSYITGVTSTSYHLEKFNRLASRNSLNNIDSALDLECHNVQRQGYIIVKEKEYDTFSGSIFDYSIVKEGESIEYRYMENNGKYFYWGKLESDSNKSGYTINNLLNYNRATSSITEDIEVETAKTSNPLKIDTVYWIEDGMVEIDGNSYYYDKDELKIEPTSQAEAELRGYGGILKYGEDGDALVPSAVTRCKDILFYPYSSSTMYEEVTKFKLTKQERQEEGFERITFARYYYYAKYKDHYCSVRQVYSGDSYYFACDIPLYILSAHTEDWLDNLKSKEYKLYFVDEYGSEGASTHYEECHTDDYLVNSDNLNKHFVYNLNDLKNLDTFIYVDEEKAYFKIEHDVLNANDGNEIILYLDNIYSPLDSGERILFADSRANRHEATVYNADNYNGKKEEYVIYNGKKYLVQKNLLDKVVINGNEYDIDYGISGKTKDIDCEVLIGDEKVPMKIKDIDGDEFSGGTLQRYGSIISGTSKSAITATYPIRPYDGIMVYGRKYIIYETKTNTGGVEDVYKYAAIDLPKEYTFTIIERIGNSMYICEPYVNATEFTDEFNRMVCGEICEEIVSNQRYYTMYVDNKIFGDREITKELPFIKTDTPISTDDYYDLYNDLRIYVKSGYIDIPISLRMDAANDVIQDDLIRNKFYEEEKKKAINPIVDMEKDVYLPKYIDGGKYEGSSTVFKPIYEINLNFHFRTRSLDSWKINDGNSLYDTSATTDNWFVTDFHPYCDLLKNYRDASGSTLMEASDLMGLLYFTNDDIFYQRSKVAKSFARLSFYDSTDPQTQSLLATSCIFVDEHKLFKRFIDNSRKNEREYGSVSEPIFKRNNSGFIIEPKEDEADNSIYTANKISANMEYLWDMDKKKNDDKYESYGSDCKNVKIDEAHRISSRLSIDNKHVTDTSSEGFYLYIFREYAEKLHPKPIYMKIEFNHAGIGKQIPFLIPMKWKKKDGTRTNKMIPERVLTLANEDDENELKKGFPLSYVYAQTYIPLYAVYDFHNKEYGYVFDSRYVEPTEDGILNLNLFEMKIMDESLEKPTTTELEDIMTNRQVKAVINVNTEQFDKKAFNYEVE